MSWNTNGSVDFYVTITLFKGEKVSVLDYGDSIGLPYSGMLLILELIMANIDKSIISSILQSETNHEEIHRNRREGGRVFQLFS